MAGLLACLGWYLRAGFGAGFGLGVGVRVCFGDGLGVRFGVGLGLGDGGRDAIGGRRLGILDG